MARSKTTDLPNQTEYGDGESLALSARMLATPLIETGNASVGGDGICSAGRFQKLFNIAHIEKRKDFVTVQNRTAGNESRCQHEWMRKKKRDTATRASVKKEMGKPRVARSASIAELNLDTSRIPEQPSTTMPGVVDKIIPALRTSQPEKAQIALDVTDPRYRKLRVENALTDEHGDDVKLKKGAHVYVTVTARAVPRD
jgi:hypothetical protein